jgi:deoxyribodipyrimidine photo-lyase
MADSLEQRPILVWFRDDLRLADNPALAAACQSRAPLVLLYVHDEESPEIRPHGGATRWWLHQSLASLSERLRAAGQTLVLRHGAAERIVPQMARTTRAAAVYWNRRHDAAAAVDDRVAATLAIAGIGHTSFAANLLHPPGSVRTAGGGAYTVFAPFWRALQKIGQPATPLPAPANIPTGVAVAGDDLNTLGLLPSGHDWTAALRSTWRPGEPAALDALADFLARLEDYGAARDRPAAAATARLSPHLRFGEISARQVWHAVASSAPSAAQDKFLSELAWREFAWHLLADHPDLASRNLKPAFDRFPWAQASGDLVRAWQQGRTGYPIVDAGMRELWITGWMHNRVRMITASFLVKHLLTDWRIGEAWFWDTLVDADAASNPFNWQWVAGSGADAQPFFRIFNPLLQGRKFDPEGAYVRRWVPELAALPDRFIHAPWTAPDDVLTVAGIRLGDTYPEPVVDHSEARQRALAAFAQLRRIGQRQGTAGRRH